MTEPPEAEDRFTTEFPALYRRAYGVAYRLLGRPGPAEDVAQETMARAYVRWNKLAEDPTGWCVTVAANLTMDALRVAQRDRRRHGELITLDRPTTRDSYLAERLDLYAALRTLPKQQRLVVTLRWIGDLSEQQTADALGISAGSVKSQSSRGLEALRRRLTPASDTLRSSHV